MDAVKTVKKEVEVTKEISEIGEAAQAIIADIRAKKSVAEIAGGNLQKLIVAVEGYDQVDDEAKSEHVHETVALALAGIAKALLKKEA